MERVPSDRIWFLSPALATALFFVSQLILAFEGPAGPAGPVAASATEGPSPTSVQVRVVAEIKPAARAADTDPVPSTEAELWQMLRRDGEVMFFSDEVEVLRTPARRFEVEEVDVITVTTDPTQRFE